MALPSPNMGLTIPVVGSDAGPVWAELIDKCLRTIDAHDHTPGKGVLIPMSGLDTSADLVMQDTNVTGVRALRLLSQTSAIPSVNPDVASVYAVAGDLWYNDGSGHQIQITQTGGVKGSGTITGMDTTTAAAEYLAGTFSFTSAPHTPAALSVGPLIIGTQVANSKTVTLAPSALQSANYTMTLPAAAPGLDQSLRSDGSGTLSWVNDQAGRIPIGGVVATFPGYLGAYSCPNLASAGPDAFGFVLCTGSHTDRTVIDLSSPPSPMNGVTIPPINNSMFIMGDVSTNAGYEGGANSYVVSCSGLLPNHYHTLDSNGAASVGPGSGSTIFGTTTAAGYFNVDTAEGPTSPSSISGTANHAAALIGRTSGTLTSPTVYVASASTDLRPLYVSATYCMRVK